jgi:hypothetical protein
MTTSTPQSFKLKVTILDIKPPIWRRVALPSSCTLADLHQVIQAAFGWGDDHLHSFTVNKVDYAPHDPEAWTESASEKISLAKLGLKKKQKFTYEYDFGDSWVHQILVEDITEVQEFPKAPICMDGARACPPEDCGGPWEYPELLEALANPKHPEHEESLDWIGGSWDPEAFDADAVNTALVYIFSRRKGWKSPKAK